MPRTEQALEVLRSGGYFRKQLERHYMGGEKFVLRLRDHRGQPVSGIGYSTFRKLEGQLKGRACPVSTVWPQEWVLAQ